MPSFIPTLQPGSMTSQAVTAADLGKLYIIAGNIHRVVKATSAITSPAGKVLVTALSSGVPTWSVATSVTANDKTVAGVVPAAYTATIAAGAYFMLQVSGPVLALSAAAILINTAVGTSTTAGKIDAVTFTVTDSPGGDTVTIPGGSGTIGYTMIAASGADEQTAIMLKGLI